MERKFKHLEFIQGVVNRLASNSFRMKGWSVLLIAALLAVLAREGHIEFAPIGLVPVIIFWGLDGYFLWQERLFRALYDHVRQLPDADIDFSMNVSPFMHTRARTWLGATCSKTLVFFHGALVIALVLASILNKH